MRTFKQIDKLNSTHPHALYSLPEDINKASSEVFLKNARYVSEQEKRAAWLCSAQMIFFKFLNF